MQTAQQVARKFLVLTVAGVASAGLGAAATAAGVDAKVGGGAQVAAPETDRAGGSADAHMSPANSNAQWQSGATRGNDRAAERMNAPDAEMTQSSGAGLETAGTAKAKGNIER